MAIDGSRNTRNSRALRVGLLWLVITTAIVLVLLGEVRAVWNDAFYVAIIAMYVALMLLVLGLLSKHRSSPLWASLLGLLAFGLVVVGLVCGVFLLPFGWERTYRADLEVWNRTTAPIYIVGRDATIRVPACEHVAQRRFVINRFEMHDDQDRFFFQSGGGGGDRPIYIMLSTMPDTMGYFLPDPPGEPLPPCQGVIEGQSGS